MVQSDIIWGDPQANRRRFEKIIKSCSDESGKKAELFVLPEMFSTGFACSENDTIENEPSETLEWMKIKAAELNAAICGSIALRLKSGRCVNRMYFVHPEGKVEHYDKRHLFGYGGEKRRFKAGRKRVIVEFRGIRFLLAVCYDLRFPVWLRNRKDYDAIICVASWPENRRFAWDTLLRARAIENQCFVASVNRIGKDPSCEYNGGSVLLSPLGGEICTAADGNAEIVYGDIDMEKIHFLRRHFPLLDDADRFRIRTL